ncbi:MAG TPA: hypothetical protein VFG78_02615 [Gemmatimonadota bacterium]|nr:hypothetical protein [Gemmatimonadota bacterium]
MLRLFVRRGLFEREDAEAMLAWPHSGFHVHDAVLVPDGDMAFALRLARYCARNPVALERLEYDASERQVRSPRSAPALGRTVTADLRSRSAPLPHMRRGDAHRRLPYTARRDRSDSGYEVHGDGPPLIMLHGGVTPSEMFGTPLAEMAKAHKVVALHARGHGLSKDSSRPWSFEVFADDVAALISTARRR